MDKPIHIDISDFANKPYFLCQKRVGYTDYYTYVPLEDIGRKDHFRATCPTCLAIAGKVSKTIRVEYAVREVTGKELDYKRIR